MMALMPTAGVLAATTVGNNVSVGGTLAAVGAATLSSSLSVSGLSTLTGGFISNASSSVGAGLQVAGALSASGTLGVAGAAVLASTLSVASLATLTSGFISNASSSVGAGLQVAGNLSVSSTLTLGGNILPSTNNSRSLGAFGLAFGDIFSSSTVYASSTSLYEPNVTSTIVLSSGNAKAGGRIIMKASNSATCYQLYFGEMGGGITLVTSTIACPAY
ncbi:MAG: hypothetical protein EXS55_04275 [Candidatus Magasanikbacteria bacterium]|nr:hypothetical protein [Candidatus Magasanikbacteria bacterium]